MSRKLKLFTIHLAMIFWLLIDFQGFAQDINAQEQEDNKDYHQQQGVSDASIQHEIEENSLVDIHDFTTMSILETIDTNDVEAIVGDIFINDKISFVDLVQLVIDNDYERLNEEMYTYLTAQVFYELSYNRSTIIHILLLTIFASIFINFSNAFGNQQVSQIGFYVIYMILLMVLLKSFQVITIAMSIKVQQLLTFMSALCPVYFLTVALAKGAHSSIVFYNLSLFYIYAVELIISSIIIPLINAYMIIEILNYLSLEKKLNKLAKLIKTLVYWLLKIMVAGVIGLNVVQGLISPVLDTVERNVWLKGAASIPVVGDAMGGSAEIMFSTLQLIKNGVGVAGAIICLIIIVGPVIQLTLLTLMYKCVSAVVEPVADTRISGCIDSVGEGCQMLLKTMVSCGLLFLVTIAIVSATTS